MVLRLTPYSLLHTGTCTCLHPTLLVSLVMKPRKATVQKAVANGGPKRKPNSVWVSVTLKKRCYRE